MRLAIILLSAFAASVMATAMPGPVLEAIQERDDCCCRFSGLCGCNIADAGGVGFLLTISIRESPPSYTNIVNRRTVTTALQAATLAAVTCLMPKG